MKRLIDICLAAMLAAVLIAATAAADSFPPIPGTIFSGLATGTIFSRTDNVESAAIRVKNANLTMGYVVGITGSNQPDACIYNQSVPGCSFFTQGADNRVSIGPGATTPASGWQIDLQGATKIKAQASDPTCATTADVGGITFNNNTTTTAFRVCVNVAGTVQWVTK